MKDYLPKIVYDLQSAAIISKPEQLSYHARTLGAKGIKQARQMLAAVYVQKGVIDSSALTPEGTMDKATDPYWRRAVYYGVYDNHKSDNLLITARLIRPTAEGVRSLQLHLEDLEPAVRQELDKLDPQTVAEFASYVKEPGLGPVTSRVVSLYLIREMIIDSRQKGIKTWVFGLRPELQKKYERLFGPALERCGNTVRLGSFNAAFIPYKVDVERSWGRFLKASRWHAGSRAVATFIGDAYATGPDKPQHRPRMRPKPSH